MGIDLSLYLTQAKVSLGYAGDEDIRLASCRATMPVAWWCCFAPEEIITGPYGPMMRAKASDARERIRAHAPRLRAAAGRHARGLRRIERTLEDHPDWWLEAYISELYYGCSLEGLRQELVQSQAVLGTGTLWATSQQGRFVRTDEAPTQELADHIVGAFEPPLGVVMSWDELVTRCNEALVQGDASELDLLEDALFCYHKEELAPFHKLLDAVEHHRYVNAQTLEAGEAILERWANGEDSVLDSIERWQLKGLEEAAKRRPRAFGHQHRRRLKQSSKPIEGLIARALCLPCPMNEMLRYALWERGGQTPLETKEAWAVIACRLVATGAPEQPLCLCDPLAIAERAAISRYHHPLSSIISPFEVAISRALRLTQADIDVWRHRYPRLVMPDYDEAPYEERLSAQLCTLLRTLELDEQTRAQLRAIEAPQDAALFGSARELVLLALGDASRLEPLLEDGAVDKNRLIAAIYASGLRTKRSLDWIKAQLLVHTAWTWEGKSLAWVLLCEAGHQDLVIKALRALRQDELSWHIEAYREGLITDDERSAYEALLRTLRGALNEQQAPTELIAQLDAVLELDT